jgi:hypothetical protein
LLLKKTLYITCHTAIQLLQTLFFVMTRIAATRRKADVCLFYAGLLVHMRLVEIFDRPEGILRAKKASTNRFSLDESTGIRFATRGGDRKHHDAQLIPE